MRTNLRSEDGYPLCRPHARTLRRSWGIATTRQWCHYRQECALCRDGDEQGLTRDERRMALLRAVSGVSVVALCTVSLWLLAINF